MQGPYGLLYWYTTSAILLLLTVINGVFKAAVWWARRKVVVEEGVDLPVLNTLEGEELDGKVEMVRPERQVLSAIRTVWEKYVLLGEVPVPSWDGRKKRVKFASMAGTEAFWNVIYILGVAVLSFHNTTDVKSWADQAGWVAVAQVPLIIALAGKNNLISVLTGISYEKLNFLHRCAGKVCLVGSWIHAAGYIYLLGGISLFQLQTSLTTWGVTSIMAFTLMYICSIPIVRRKIYEFFLVAHICLAALFLGGVIMHWRAVSIWIYPGIGLWALDRLIRILRLVIMNNIRSPSLSQDSATLTLLTPSTLKLSFPAPFPWVAGQHFYVLVPGMSRLPWELHPFTAATVPSDKGELSFIIRVRDGFTRRMKEKVDLAKRARGLGAEDECSVRVTGAVEGPYGQGAILSHHEAVVIFAGGSGVSFALAHLLTIISTARAGRAQTRMVKIIWMVKSRLHLNWISPILLAHTHQLPSNLKIELHIHVTKRYNQTLPADPEMASIDWQAYMDARMAQPRDRRKMSTMSWATFAGEGDEDGTQTRRGSEYVIRGERVRRRSTRPAPPSLDIVDTDAPGEVLRTFTWNDGYNDPLPLEDEHRSSIESSHRSPGSSIANVNWGARGEPRRKVSFADDASHTSRRSQDSLPTPKRKVSFADDTSNPRQSQDSLHSPIHSPSPRRISLVSVEELQGPPLQPRRRSSGMSKRKASLPLPGIMPDITEMSPRVEMNPTIDAPLDVLDSVDPLKIDFEPATPVPPHAPDLKVDFQSSFAANRNALQPPPLAFDMSRSSSAQSATSISSLLGSGVVTPALSEPGNTFDDTEDQRRRQSLGLEEIVHWHEGRADPREIISTAKAELHGRDVESGKGSGGRVQVLVCGPASLMKAVKDAAREEMDFGAVLRGGVSVGFHSESFGW